jgi:ribosomal-protein-serine acetyltransferase
MELADDTVRLRTPVPDDAPKVAATVRGALPTLRPWMPWATEDYGIDDATAWITGTLEPGAVPFVILDDHGAIVGSAGLNQIDGLNLRANLGYWLHPDHTGRGYATAATRLVATHGLDHLGLQRIEITMSVENEASRRVADRAGALHEGIQRNRLRLHGRQHDAHMFAFLADGPRP